MLRERIDNDLKKALKSKDAIKVSTLRFLKAAIQNLGISKQKEPDDEDILSVVKRQVKQRKDSIESFRKGNREDLADKESKELEILKAYLPEEIKPEELLAIVREAIAQTGAASGKDMGKVIKTVMAKAKGRADGKTVSAIVNKELSKDTEA